MLATQVPGPATLPRHDPTQSRLVHHPRAPGARPRLPPRLRRHGRHRAPKWHGLPHPEQARGGRPGPLGLGGCAHRAAGEATAPPLLRDHRRRRRRARRSDEAADRAGPAAPSGPARPAIAARTDERADAASRPDGAPALPVHGAQRQPSGPVHRSRRLARDMGRRALVSRPPARPARPAHVACGRRALPPLPRRVLARRVGTRPESGAAHAAGRHSARRTGARCYTGSHSRGRAVARAHPRSGRDGARRDAGCADSGGRHRTGARGAALEPRAGRADRPDGSLARSSFGRSARRVRRSRPWPASARRS